MIEDSSSCHWYNKNVVHPLGPFKFSPSINFTDVIRSIVNTQAIKIGRQQVRGRSGLFTFEAWQNDILAHVHGHCNILWSGAWLLCLYMKYIWFLYISLKSYAWIFCKLDERTCHFDFFYCVFCTSNLTSLIKSGLFLSSSQHHKNNNNNNNNDNNNDNTYNNNKNFIYLFIYKIIY